MHRTHLIHNPSAGAGEFSKEKLISMIEQAGFECGYSSTKDEDWMIIKPDVEFLIVAGGDGTVKKLATALLEGKLRNGSSFPIALLPLGVANNIAKSLDIRGEPQEIIASWHRGSIRKYDIGYMNQPSGARFFIESLGFGLFPYLIKEMDSTKDQNELSPEESLERALKMLLEMIPSYTAKDCEIQIDGQEVSGKFLMAEIMNIDCIGPNLNLAPSANSGDGLLELVLIPERQRAKLASYVLNRINGSVKSNSFQSLSGKKVNIAWNGKHAHVDDELINFEKKTEFKIEVKSAALEFIVAEENNKPENDLW